MQERYNGSKENALHRHYLRFLAQTTNQEQAFMWLAKGSLKSSAEALLIAAQVQTLNTKTHAKNIMKAQEMGSVDYVANVRKPRRT